MIELEVWLYGKPSWDMSFNGTRLRPALLRRRARALSRHLLEVADVFETLLRHGWQCRGVDCALRFFHHDVHTKEEAISALHLLGVQRRLIKLIRCEEHD